jgi:hypothetical protein
MNEPDNPDDTQEPSIEPSTVKHPHFDLWLHGTEGLEASLGQQILGRETIHEWPLSCVQRLDCADETYIYKVQLEPTVEPNFYATASSSLLPAHRNLGKINECHSMVFDCLAGKRLADQSVDVRDLLTIGARLQSRIGDIEGELPVYMDIGSEEKWLSSVDETLRALSGLIGRSVFASIPRETLSRLREWAESVGVVELIEVKSTYCHGDLSGGNIFIDGDELKLIDWQRPRIAPPSVDLAGLLIQSGHDASAHVEREAIQIFFFLVIAWCVECQVEFIPQVHYEKHILAAASQILGHSNPGP